MRAVIDTESEPGAWAKALKAPCSYRTITEHPGEPNPLPAGRETDGAASDNTGAAPALCDVSVHNGCITS